MDLKAIKALCATLRAAGVVQWTDGPISVTLGDKPQRAARGLTKGQSLEDSDEPAVRDIMQAIHEANHRAGVRE